MSIGAFFILLVVLGVVVILGGGLYALTMWLRHKQLDPEGDKVEGTTTPDASRAEHEEAHNERVGARGSQPKHVRVENEQRRRFVGTR
jgi:hypothetical protein